MPAPMHERKIVWLSFSGLMLKVTPKKSFTCRRVFTAYGVSSPSRTSFTSAGPIAHSSRIRPCGAKLSSRLQTPCEAVCWMQAQESTPTSNHMLVDHELVDYHPRWHSTALQSSGGADAEGLDAVAMVRQGTWWVLSTAPPRLTSSNSCWAARLPTSSGTAASSPCKPEHESSLRAARQSKCKAALLQAYMLTVRMPVCKAHCAPKTPCNVTTAMFCVPSCLRRQRLLLKGSFWRSSPPPA
jgi:hypothetical protein